MLQFACKENNKNMSEISEKIESFFSQYRTIDCKAKETIIHMSDEPSGVYFVSNGFVKMNTILANGNELTLNIFKPGSFFPMTWAIANIGNNYLYQTITSANIYKAPKEDVIKFLKNNQDVLFDLTKRVFSGMDGLMTNITHLVFGNAQNRVSSALLLCARRFGEKKEKGKIAINIHLTHQDIANIAGLTRETTSIEMGKLKRNKIISKIKGGIIISKFDELEKKAQVEDSTTKPIYTL